MRWSRIFVEKGAMQGAGRAKGRLRVWAPSATHRRMSDEKWRWRYSGWTGIWYGPIPVALIVVGPALVWVWFRIIRDYMS